MDEVLGDVALLAKLLATHGQLYWSDTHQLNLYLESYHDSLDQRLGRGVRGSEMITEIYVPRRRLTSFMDEVRKDFRANQVDFIYGTIRLIEKDTESALPWAIICPGASSTRAPPSRG